MATLRDPYRIALEVGATLTASLDLDEVFATIARQVGQALDVQWCDINEYDPVANTMTYVAVWARQLRKEDLDYIGTIVDLNERPARGEVLARGGDLLIAYLDDPDLDAQERAVMEEYDEWGTMELPLVYAGEAIGVLGVADSRRGRRFSEEDKQLLRLLAQPAAVAIGNARAYRAQREQARLTSAMLASSRALAATVDEDEVLNRVAQLAVEVVQASQSAIYEYRAASDDIVYRSVCVPSGSLQTKADDPIGTAYPLADRPGERGILATGTIVEERISDSDLPEDRRTSMEAWGELGVLSVPLRFGDEPIGILRLYDMERESSYSPAELELLAALGEQASAAIHNARLFRQQRDHSERLLGLFATSRSLAATFDFAGIVAAVEDGAQHLFVDEPRAQVWLRTDDGVVAPAASVLSGVFDGAPQPSVVAREALAAQRPSQMANDDGSELVVPFATKGRADGFVCVDTLGLRVFAPPEIEALQVLANQTGVALENMRLYRQVEEQAVHDGLTSLYNHRYFYERLEQECARASRYGLPLSLLMIDIDDFKQFNDRYGHLQGDKVLRHVADILLDGTRRGVDLPARYGGEEFAVILPHTAPTGAGVVGDRLQRQIAALHDLAVPAAADLDEIPPAGNGAVQVGERLRHDIEERAAADAVSTPARVTVSVGVAAGQGKLICEDELVRHADEALYRAKRSGKNQVAVYG